MRSKARDRSSNELRGSPPAMISSETAKAKAASTKASSLCASAGWKRISATASSAMAPSPLPIPDRR